jgi:hypothetical protein
MFLSHHRRRLGQLVRLTSPNLVSACSQRGEQIRDPIHFSALCYELRSPQILKLFKGSSNNFNR